MPVKKIKTFLSLLSATLLVLFSDQKLLAQSAATPKSALEMRAEIYDQYEQTNDQVAGLFAAAISFLDGSGNQKAQTYKSALSAAQMSWLNYRGSHCQIISDQSKNAPTGPDQFYYQCVSEINQKRIEELEALLLNFKLQFGTLKTE